MSETAAIRIAVASPRFVETASRAQIADWLSAADPGAIVLAGEETAEARRILARRGSDETVVLDPSRGGRKPEAIPLAGGDVVLAPTAEALEAALHRPSDDTESGDPGVVVTGALELDVDTTTLSTTLHGREVLEAAPAIGRSGQDQVAPGTDRVGQDEIASGTDRAEQDQVAPGTDRAGQNQIAPRTDLAGPVVLSTGLPPDFRRTIGTTTLVGAGDRTGTGDDELHVFSIGSDGRVLTRTMRPDRLGLRAIDQVGTERARTLRQAGYDTRDAVAEASTAAIQDLDGIGRSTAATIATSARAMAEGTVVRHHEEPMPVADPLFVDIETDGLNPTVTWLIGVLDGSPTDGEYRSFLATDPEDPGAAIEDFLTWYESRGESRPLVAYNGRTFDFSVIADHVAAYRQELEAVFERAPRFDPYHWAVREENACLPGRTDRLEDVATYLGFEPAVEGLTGAAVARRYRQWLEDPRPATEPDWDLLDSYCEDDVRALSHVFRALETDAATTGSDRSSRRHRSETTQGTLADW